MGVKKELMIETASRTGAVFIRGVLHCGRVASHESEMNSCGTDQAKELAQFHQQVVAYVGQFSTVFSEVVRMKTGPLFLFGVLRLES